MPDGFVRHTLFYWQWLSTDNGSGCKSILMAHLVCICSLGLPTDAPKVESMAYSWLVLFCIPLMWTNVWQIVSAPRHLVSVQRGWNLSLDSCAHGAEGSPRGSLLFCNGNFSLNPMKNCNILTGITKVFSSPGTMQHSVVGARLYLSNMIYKFPGACCNLFLRAQSLLFPYALKVIRFLGLTNARLIWMKIVNISVSYLREHGKTSLVLAAFVGYFPSGWWRAKA